MFFGFFNWGGNSVKKTKNINRRGVSGKRKKGAFLIFLVKNPQSQGGFWGTLAPRVFFGVFFFF